MASIFTKIIQGDIPCYKIAEDSKHIAFLDIRPLAKGHTLVIPKREVDYIYDLEDQELADLHLFAKKVATGMKKAVECIRVGVLVVGTEVPHAHIHLIPFNTESEMSIMSPRLEFNPHDMADIAREISEAIES